jgi:hypothetical protein
MSALPPKADMLRELKNARGYSADRTKPYREIAEATAPMQRDAAVSSDALRSLAALNPHGIARIAHTNRRMLWGQAIALFAVACFGAFTLFMVRRKPQV